MAECCWSTFALKPNAIEHLKGNFNMPGIAGFISKGRQEGSAIKAQIMIDCIMHEPFYGSAMYFDEKYGVYAGAVNHLESFSDCMPVFNEKKDLILLFTGENFADKKSIAALKKRCHPCDYSNASYLIHLYEEDKERFFRQLNGFFSGIIIDKQENKLIIFNDRYGMQRIYYYEDECNFYFSSEAKSLLKVCPELRLIDMQSLGEFINCGSVLQNRSLFENVLLMPGGSVWTFQGGGQITKDYYFRPQDWENQVILEEKVFYEKLKETFLNILPLYFYAKEPVGMSVTGGLDSRMIHACIDSSQSYKCYTFGGLYGNCLDVSIGSKVAAVCNQNHEIIRLDSDFFKDFHTYAEKTIYVTDGCHDVCGSHDLYFNILARKVSSIRISGKFGGEVLRSVTNLKAGSFHRELFDPGFYSYINDATKSVDEIRHGTVLTNSVFKAIPWVMYGCLAAEKSQVTFRSPYMDNDLIGLIYQAPDHVLHSNKTSLRLIADNNPCLAGILTDRGFGGEKAFYMSKIYELLYFSLYKLDWYYGVGMPGWMSEIESKPGIRLLRNLFLGTQRIDHYRIWFQNELSGYVQQILLDKLTLGRTCYDKNKLEYMVKSHICGKRNYINEIKTALTLELIYRSLIDE